MLENWHALFIAEWAVKILFKSCVLNNNDFYCFVLSLYLSVHLDIYIIMTFLVCNLNPLMQ